MSNNVDLYIQELEIAKAGIKDAIIAKGVTPEGGLSSYADAINNIVIPTFKTEVLSVELTDNGIYNYTPTKDGYSSVEVTVEVAGVIPDEELQQMLQDAMDEGYQDGYAEGVDDGIEEQKAALESITIKDNGTYTREDGWNSVTVEVAGAGDSGKPKIYNGFKLLSTNSTLPTTDRLTTKLQEVDFTQYDWSQVYDLSEFFGGFMKNNSYGAGAFVDSDFDNFRAGYNGQMISCKDMFNTAPGASSNYTLKEIPDFSMFTDKLVNMSGAFSSSELLLVDNIVKWNTSNVVDMSKLFYYCSKLSSVPVFDTSSVINMNSMFYYCTQLKTVPLLDYSKAIDICRLFCNCTGLTEIPNLDISSARSFAMSSGTTSSSGSNSWIYNSSNITSIGALQCDSITDIGYIFGGSSNTKITQFGGCINLGKIPTGLTNFSGNYAFNYAPNIDYQSVMNVINGLYDRAAAGYPGTTLKLHANHLAMLSEDDIAIATNKGWTLS